MPLTTLGKKDLVPAKVANFHIIYQSSITGMCQRLRVKAWGRKGGLTGSNTLNYYLFLWPVTKQLRIFHLHC